MRRTEVLCILRPLVTDVQKIIFRQVFPTKQQVENFMSSQCETPYDFLEIDEFLSEFVHGDENVLILEDLEKRERKFVHERCGALKLAHQSGEYTDNGLKDITVSKPAAWFFDLNGSPPTLEWTSWSEWMSRKRRRYEEIVECELCGAVAEESQMISSEDGLHDYLCEECADEYDPWCFSTTSMLYYHPRSSLKSRSKEVVEVILFCTQAGIAYQFYMHDSRQLMKHSYSLNIATSLDGPSRGPLVWLTKLSRPELSSLM